MICPHHQATTPNGETDEIQRHVVTKPIGVRGAFARKGFQTGDHRENRLIQSVEKLIIQAISCTAFGDRFPDQPNSLPRIPLPIRVTFFIRYVALRDFGVTVHQRVLGRHPVVKSHYSTVLLIWPEVRWVISVGYDSLLEIANGLVQCCW